MISHRQNTLDSLLLLLQVVDRLACRLGSGASMLDYFVDVVGEGGVGKTALVIQLINCHFVEESDPTIEESFRKQWVVDDEVCLVDVLDTAGQDEYAVLREGYVRPCEGFIFMYSIANRASFERLEEYFDLAVKRRMVDSLSLSEIPSVLVGNKIDLDEMRVVDTEEGAELARENGMAFLETSCKTRTNVDEVFAEAVRAIRRSRSPPSASKPTSKNSKCSIM